MTSPHKKSRSTRSGISEEILWELRIVGRFASYHRWIMLVILSTIVVCVVWLRPWPPQKAHLATAQAGSSYSALAESLQKTFEQYGYKLELIETPGLEQGFTQLRDTSNPVDASFVTAGSKRPSEYANLVSLGSIKNAPLWLFYRGAKYGDNPFIGLSQQRIAVGLPGSTSLSLFTELLRVNGRTLQDAPKAQLIADAEALQRFRQGELDAVFLVDGVDSATVQSLLAVSGVRVLDFGANQAYVKKIPFLKTVTLPQGSVDLQRMFPPTDLTLLSSTVTLLVEANMHPVHQWLFLKAIKEISAERGAFFSRSGDFPAYLDKSVPLSPVAQIYFDRGIPASFQFLSPWLATLYERLWLLSLVLLAPLLPLVVGWQQLKSFGEICWIDRVYSDIASFEDSLKQTRWGPAQRQALSAEFERLDALIAEALANDPHTYEGLRWRWDATRAQWNAALSVLV